jgi:hypothetical protein
MLRPAPAPIAAALLARDHALFDHGDRQILLGERIGGRNAGDAAADHHDVGGARQLFVGRHGLHRHHRSLTSLNKTATN